MSSTGIIMLGILTVEGWVSAQLAWARWHPILCYSHYTKCKSLLQSSCTG